MSREYEVDGMLQDYTRLMLISHTPLVSFIQQYITPTDTSCVYIYTHYTLVYISTLWIYVQACIFYWTIRV